MLLDHHKFYRISDFRCPVKAMKHGRQLFLAESYLKKSHKNAEAILDLGDLAEPGAFESAWADVEYWQAQVNNLSGNH